MKIAPPLSAAIAIKETQESVADLAQYELAHNSSGTPTAPLSIAIVRSPKPIRHVQKCPLKPSIFV